VIGSSLTAPLQSHAPLALLSAFNTDFDETMDETQIEKKQQQQKRKKKKTGSFLTEC